MENISSKFTVYFENPFWVGVYERECNNRYEICKITFGSQPKDSEVYEFILRNWNRLKFSSSIISTEVNNKRINPKRMQREIKKSISDKGIGNKAQNALKLQYEENKFNRKKRLKQKRIIEKDIKFISKQEKRKQKHRGH